MSDEFSLTELHTAEKKGAEPYDDASQLGVPELLAVDHIPVNSEPVNP